MNTNDAVFDQKRNDADSWIARAVREPRDFDKITSLLALVEGESISQGMNSSREQWNFILEIREKVRAALLNLLAEQSAPAASDDGQEGTA